MTNRERFLRLMRYEPVDRLPVMALEPFEKPAVDRWHREGLPPEQTPVEFLGMAKLVYAGGVGLHPIPAFEEEILAEDSEYVVTRTAMGTTVRSYKAAPTTFYGHIDHPVKTRADWELYKARLDPDAPQRLAGLLGSETVGRLNASDDAVGLCFWPFFFRLGFYTMGMERFLTAFHDEPDLIHDMFSHSSRLVLALLPRILGAVKVDFAVFAEDLAGKNGPLVSPRTYAEFWYPYQDPVVRMLRDAGVPVICQWSAGQFDELLPSLLEHGFNCAWPLERMAGMDARALRKSHGRRLLLTGNIAKEAVIEGPQAIDREIERLMPLIREGGFLPALDDMPPMECPFSHYRYMIQRLQDIRLG
jgi:uroporphyrinogen-III decarboxylase